MINERLTIVTDIVSEDLDEPLLTVLKMSNQREKVSRVFLINF